MKLFWEKASGRVGEGSTLLHALFVVSLAAGVANAQYPPVKAYPDAFYGGQASTVTVTGGNATADGGWYVIGSMNADVPSYIPPGVTGPGLMGAQCKLLWVAKCNTSGVATFTPPVEAIGQIVYIRAIQFDSKSPDGMLLSGLRMVAIKTPPPPPPPDPDGNGGDLDAGIPLVAHDLSGTDRVGDLMQCSVPFAKTANIKSASGIAVLDSNGVAVPAQFRVMQRWGNVNDLNANIAWLLVEYRGNCKANGTATYTLKKTAAPSFPQVAVTKTADGYLVDTGVALFQLSSKTNHLFENVYLDLDGNGQYGSSERVAMAATGTGAQLLAIDGVNYSSEYDTPTITVLDQRSGPAATRLRVSGRHRASTSTQGVGRDVLKYSTYLEFSPGSTEVRVIHTLRNDYVADPIGPVAVKNYEVALKFDTASDPSTKATGYGDNVAAPWSGLLSSIQRLEIYQDSSGGPNWTATPGTTFKGYRMFTGQPTAPVTVSSGNRAAGIGDISTSKYGLTVAGRYFWQTFPKSMEFQQSGRISLKMLPANFAGLQWLDDSQNCTSEFLLAFHMGSTPSLSSARAFQRPVRPVAPLPYIQKTKAWPDHGDLPAPLQDKSQWASMAISYKSQNDSGHDVYDNWGWPVFGEERWYQNTHTTGSPRNVLTAFPRFAETGRLEYFEVAEEGALHAASIRQFHLDGFVASEHKNSYIFEGIPYPNTNAYPDDVNRSAVANKYPSLKTGIPAGGSGWNGFDEEHMTVDDVYEYTLLTGHPLTEEALVQIAEEILTFPFVRTPGTKPLATRGAAWCLRALLKAYFISGAQRFLDGATNIVKNVNQYRGKAPNAWCVAMQDYGKAFPGNYTDTYESPWQMGPFLHAAMLYYNTTGDPMVKTMMVEMADYLCGPAWGPNGNFKRFVKTKDWNEWVICTQYDGVGQWIPSALLLVNRMAPKSIYVEKAQAQYDFTYGALGSSWAFNMNDALWHWWLVFFSEKQNKNIP